RISPLLEKFKGLVKIGSSLLQTTALYQSKKLGVADPQYVKLSEYFLHLALRKHVFDGNFSGRTHFGEEYRVEAYPRDFLQVNSICPPFNNTVRGAHFPKFPTRPCFNCVDSLSINGDSSLHQDFQVHVGHCLG